jgi:riboflavin synthase
LFTGIIEHLGEIVVRCEGGTGVTFTVRCESLRDALKPGDSVSINGVCHTVERAGDDRFSVTSVAQTLRVTTMSDLAEGMAVNLETAATAETALGGHIVQGHVDGVAQVVSFAEAGDDRLLTIELPEDVHDVLVSRGSIAIDGVSLTVAERHEGPRVTIAIVPYTLENTIIGRYGEGTRVNVEAVVIGKYVKQYVDRLAPAARPGGIG